MVEKFAKELLSKISSMNGKLVGQDMQISKTRLAQDNKGAMVNDVVDKYMKKELDDEYLEKVKQEFGIQASDIAREIAKREIEKVLGT